MSIIIQTENLCKIYNQNTDNEVKAVTDISLNVEEGSFVSIMGPSGAGKTTLINNVSTMDMPTSGNVIIDGVNINNMSEKDICNFRSQKLGFVFQQFNLLDTMNIYENIAIPLIMKKTDRVAIDQQINKLAQYLEIEDILYKFPAECSVGQRQRVAIARAIITEPKILIADEPTGNLDSKNSHQLLMLLKRLCNEKRITILLVTHSPMIASYADRMLYIQDGRLKTIVEKKYLSQEEYLNNIIEITSGQEFSLLF